MKVLKHFYRSEKLLKRQTKENVLVLKAEKDLRGKEKKQKTSDENKEEYCQKQKFY